MKKKIQILQLAAVLILTACASKNESQPQALITYRISSQEIEIITTETNYSERGEELFVWSFIEGFEDRLNHRSGMNHWMDSDEGKIGDLAYTFGITEADAIQLSNEESEIYTSNLANPRADPRPTLEAPKHTQPIDPFSKESQPVVSRQ